MTDFAQNIRILESPRWLWIVFLTMGVILAYAVSSYRNQLKKYLLATFSQREINEINRDESELNRKAGLTFNIFYILSLTLFLFTLLDQSELINISDELLLLYTLVGVLAWFSLKYGFVYFLGILFKTQTTTRNFVNTSFTSNKSLGIILFPLTVLLNYSSDFGFSITLISLSVWGIYTIIKWFNGINLGLSQQGFPKFYPFLYICTLEILPVAIFAKVFFKSLFSAIA